MLVATEQIAVFHFSSNRQTKKDKQYLKVRNFDLENEVLSLRLSFCLALKNEDLWANLLPNIIYSEHYRFAVSFVLLFYMNMLLAN